MVAYRARVVSATLALAAQTADDVETVAAVTELRPRPRARGGPGG